MSKINPDDEIVIQLNLDGFKATINPDDWPNARHEFRVVEVEKDEQDIPQNLDVWEGIDFFQTLEQPE